jgi:hypothetical protein
LQLESLESRSLLAVFTAVASAPDGQFNSLRGVIQQANGNGENDTINLSTGVYKLTIINNGQAQENAAASGDLDLTEGGKTITIVGQGASTVIDAKFIDRVFQVFPNVTATFKNLVIRNAFAFDDGTDGTTPTTTPIVRGGGLLIAAGANVTLDNVLLTSTSTQGSFTKTAAQGGGIYTEGSLTIRNSTLSDDQSVGGTPTGAAGQLGEGGAIYGAATSAINITNSAISSNAVFGGQDAGAGPGSAQGGGIVANGTLTLTDSTVAENQAFGGNAVAVVSGGAPSGGNGSAGGILVTGTAVITNTEFTDNLAQGGSGGNSGPAATGGSGGTGQAGALMVSGGTATLTGGRFQSNLARGGAGGSGGSTSGTGTIGGTGGAGGSGVGGAILVFGNMTATNVNSVVFNSASGGVGGAGGAGETGGQGGVGGTAMGAGVFVAGGSTVDVNTSSIAANTASGASGGTGGSGSAVGGVGGLSGDGEGAGLFVGSNIAGGGDLTVRSSTIQQNVAFVGSGGAGGFGSTGASGGAGGAAGHALGAGLAVDGGTAVVVRSLLNLNTAQCSTGGAGGNGNVNGGDGGAGGAAQGGAIAVLAGTVSPRDSTFNKNRVLGGSGGKGGNGTANTGGAGGVGGLAQGGALYNAAVGVLSVRNSTLAENSATDGTGGAGGSGGAGGGANGADVLSQGGGVFDAGTFNSSSSIYANNTAGSDVDVSGSFNTASNNLLKTLTGATGIANNVNGNIVGLDPKLGPLGFSFGSQVMLLLPGSPAIDRGDNSLNLPTDQRGLPRVGGTRADIGAVELQPAKVNLGGTITYHANAPALVLASGATVSDADSSDFNGGKLTVSIATNADAADRLAIVNQGTASGQIGVSGANVMFGGTMIGTFSGGSGSTPLVVLFNASATPAAAQALVRVITFRSATATPSTAQRKITFVINDGDGTNSSAATATKTVNVSAT